jgi:hypothetical protein
MNKNLESKVTYNLFNYEMNRLKNIKYTSYEKTLKEIGISRISSTNCSTKLTHNGKLNMLTYGLYLASSDASGINVCPKSDMCRESCLVGSGYAKIDALSGNNTVQNARIVKTRLFFANRPLFMKLMCMEINRAMNKAKRLNMEFSVRLNCTSDISPLAFKVGDMNILEMYPNVMFYDYTKVKAHWKVAEKYSNYHITFSRDGSMKNESECMEWLSKGNNVAVVFGVTKTSELPKKWRGYEVLVGDDYDYRVWDKLQVGKQIVGLIYKVGKNDFEKVGGKSHFKGIPNIPFIIQANDKDCEY